MVQRAILLLATGAALSLSACGKKDVTAMALCQQLEASGVAKECHDTSSTICKYARERVTFSTPTGAGQALRFANGAQFDTMSKLVNRSRIVFFAENREALALVQVPGDVPGEAAQKIKAIVEKLPPVPTSEVVAVPTCTK